MNKSEKLNALPADLCRLCIASLHNELSKEKKTSAPIQNIRAKPFLSPSTASPGNPRGHKTAELQGNFSPAILEQRPPSKCTRREESIKKWQVSTGPAQQIINRSLLGDLRTWPGICRLLALPHLDYFLKAGCRSSTFRHALLKLHWIWNHAKFITLDTVQGWVSGKDNKIKLIYDTALNPIHCPVQIQQRPADGYLQKQFSLVLPTWRKKSKRVFPRLKLQLEHSPSTKCSSNESGEQS